MLTSGAYGYLSDYLLFWLLLVSLLVHTWCFFQMFPRQKYKKLGLAQFSKEVHRVFPDVETARHRDGEDRRRYFDGIGWSVN